MNLFTLAILLIVSPSVMQLIFGGLAIKKKTAFSFSLTTFLCCVAQVAFIFIAIRIVTTSAQNQHVRCGLPQATMAFAGFVFSMILLIIISIQLFVRRKSTINPSELKQVKK